ncbi:Gfo/Idh/MocA family protein [Helicobacter cetorum]|uniref:Gfo/Idh/MocA family protein n=1 Tax=Helicobacter cetorum TaxID=138563 RepID=UPI0013152F45|nr:Gfo/Idh/MocA family oxidoreductase [Helicobacter cetorum]
MKKVALLGYGYWGKNLARSVIKTEFFELVGILDNALLAREQAKKDYPCVKIYHSLEELLLDKEIEVILIATPANTHASLVKQCLKASKHVFVEKPLSFNYIHALKLYELAKEYRLILFCDYTFTYSNAVRWLKKHMHELGEIKSITSERLNFGIFRQDCDVLWDLALHDISILNYLLGDLLLEKVSVAKMCQTNAQAFVIGSYKQVFINICVSWLHEKKVRKMVLIGEQKSVIYEDTSQTPILVYDTCKPSLKAPKFYVPKLEKTLSLDNALKAFYQNIKQGGIETWQKENVLQTIAILEKAEILAKG